MKVFFSIVAFFVSTFLFMFFFDSIGLKSMGDFYNSDPSMYEDDEWMTGLSISILILSIIFALYVYKVSDQKKIKPQYDKIEKSKTIDWIKGAVFFGILTTIVDYNLDYNIKSTLSNYTRYLSNLVAAFIVWYFFGRKYWNPLSHWKIFK